MKSTLLKSGITKLTTIIKIPSFNFTTNPFRFLGKETTKNDRSLVLSPFKAMVQKEITDHITNWRFIILFAIITLACLGTLFSTLADGMKVLVNTNSENNFFFLNLFTKSDGSLPPYFVFVGFLGPLFGISLGFDAISSEQNKGTLSRILAQPFPGTVFLMLNFWRVSS